MIVHGLSNVIHFISSHLWGEVLPRVPPAAWAEGRAEACQKQVALERDEGEFYRRAHARKAGGWHSELAS